MKKSMMGIDGMASTPRWAILAILAAALHAQMSFAGTTDVLATVNGAAIREGDLDEAMVGRQPAARREVLQGLIARELLRQAAEREGLGDSEPVRAAMQKAKIDAENRFYVARHIAVEPVTDAQVHERYQAIAGDVGRYQYQVSRMTFADEPTARFALMLLGSGQTFAQIAARVPASDVQTSWVSFRTPATEGHTQGLPAAVAQSIAALKPGDITSSPIRAGDGFIIARLDDRRDMTVPSYEQAQAPIRKAMQAQRNRDAFTALVDQLAKKATIRPVSADGSAAK